MASAYVSSASDGRSRFRRATVSSALPQIGVAMLPGSTMATSRFQGFSSKRRASVKASSAYLEAQYGARNGDVTRPLIEPTTTTRPRPLRISGMNACVTATVPKRFTSNCSRHSSRGRNSIGPPRPMPALFTRPTMPRSPIVAAISSRAELMLAWSVTSMRNGRMRSEPWRRRRSASASFRTPAKMVKPALSRRRAQASPMPVEAPVMTIAPREAAPLV